MKGDIKQRIADTRAAIVAELAKLGLPAALVGVGQPYWASNCVGVGEYFPGERTRRGTGLVAVRVAGVYGKEHKFRPRFLKEAHGRPVNARLVARRVAERLRVLELAEAETNEREAGLAAFRSAIGDRSGRDFAVLPHHNRAEVSFEIANAARVGPILDGLAGLLRGAR